MAHSPGRNLVLTGVSADKPCAGSILNPDGRPRKKATSILATVAGRCHAPEASIPRRGPRCWGAHDHRSGEPNRARGAVTTDRRLPFQDYDHLIDAGPSNHALAPGGPKAWR